MFFDFLDLSPNANVGLQLYHMRGYKMSETFLLQTQQNFFHMWLDHVRSGNKHFDSLEKIGLAMPDALYQPGVLKILVCP